MSCEKEISISNQLIACDIMRCVEQITVVRKKCNFFFWEIRVRIMLLTRLKFAISIHNNDIHIHIHVQFPWALATTNESRISFA